MPSDDKPGAYSWLKAPRYDKQVYEVGPLAQMVTTYASGNKQVKALGLDPSPFPSFPRGSFFGLGETRGPGFGGQVYCRFHGRMVTAAEAGGGNVCAL